MKLPFIEVEITSRDFTGFKLQGLLLVILLLTAVFGLFSFTIFGAILGTIALVCSVAVIFIALVENGDDPTVKEFFFKEEKASNY